MEENKTYSLHSKVDFGKYKGLTINQIISKEKYNCFKWFVFISTFKSYSHIKFDNDVKKKIFSKNRLNLSDKDIKILKKIDGNISKKLLEVNTYYLNTDSYNFKFDFTKLTISYKTFFNKSKTEMRIGKFITKLFNGKSIEYTNKDLEDFITNLKAIEEGDGNLILVDGEDIRKYYDESTYSKASGTLNKSCMRYNKYQPFFDIYCENPSKVKMLIYKEEDKIKGRALIWYGVRFTSVSISSDLLMDRIYSTNPAIEKQFKNWAEKNNVVYKYAQNHNSKKEFVFKKKAFVSKIEVDIPKVKENVFPYFDTFPWVVIKNLNDFSKGIKLRNLKENGEVYGRARNCRGVADFKERVEEYYE